ncbi:hypothetical protein DFH08DRAFT_944139 [Mycena albidolilacea]|uniref:Uncharacterized protein n=1 Tax=Mycena albidolilacea TaxID=1033008 RepID=A0AAD6Z714_9AGAR|nr:hypothetical protein DFH08DRAFT_944139 [Mycena albidolilacea]
MPPVKIGADIKSDHQQCGLVKLRTRAVHKSTEALLTVPRYHELIQEEPDDNTTSRRSVVISTASGWRDVMNKWIADAQAAADNETANPNKEASSPSKWKKKTLAVPGC